MMVGIEHLIRRYIGKKSGAALLDLPNSTSLFYGIESDLKFEFSSLRNVCGPVDPILHSMRC